MKGVHSPTKARLLKIRIELSMHKDDVKFDSIKSRRT